MNINNTKAVLYLLWRDSVDIETFQLLKKAMGNGLRLVVMFSVFELCFLHVDTEKGNNYKSTGVSALLTSRCLIFTSAVA